MTAKNQWTARKIQKIILNKEHKDEKTGGKCMEQKINSDQNQWVGKEEFDNFGTNKKGKSNFQTNWMFRNPWKFRKTIAWKPQNHLVQSTGGLPKAI